MAAATKLSHKIDIHLRAVRGALEALPGVERWWIEADPAVPPEQQRVDRIDFREEWGLAVSRLSCLDEAHQTRKMSTDQAARYAALLALVGDVLPIMERLRLELPPDSVLQRLASFRQPSAASAVSS